MVGHGTAAGRRSRSILSLVSNYFFFLCMRVHDLLLQPELGLVMEQKNPSHTDTHARTRTCHRFTHAHPKTERSFLRTCEQAHPPRLTVSHTRSSFRFFALHRTLDHTTAVLCKCCVVCSKHGFSSPTKHEQRCTPVFSFPPRTHNTSKVSIFAAARLAAPTFD